jgi:hypothetical protein
MNLKPAREIPPPGSTLKVSTRPKAAVPSAPTAAMMAVSWLKEGAAVISIFPPEARNTLFAKIQENKTTRTYFRYGTGG